MIRIPIDLIIFYSNKFHVFAVNLIYVTIKKHQNLIKFKKQIYRLCLSYFEIFIFSNMNIRGLNIEFGVKLIFSRFLIL